MIRVKDTSAVEFFRDKFGMTLLHYYKFDGFSLHFMASLADAEASLPEPGTSEAEKYLWAYPGVVLELTLNKMAPEGGYKTGNEQNGFGHLAFFAKGPIEEYCENLEMAGVGFKKRLSDGRMKTIAFAYSQPDRYWLELISHGAGEGDPQGNWCQTMYRITDPEKSVHFYRDVLGMKLVSVRKFSDFSLYFLCDASVEFSHDPYDEDKSRAFLRTLWNPVLELTHNHNSDPVHPGNGPDDGYGHIGFLVDDLAAATLLLDSHKVPFAKRPEEGRMKNLAFCLDPDGYKVEIIQRGFST